jgi:biopolymer transport protein TolR
MKRYKKKNNIINQMNVVPYIDVMLVLLVIFMVTAPMFVPSVINLPSVGKASQVNKSPIQVGINRDNHYSVTQDNKTTNVDNVNELIMRIRPMMADAETPVVIAADKNISYNDVISVVDKLYTAGIKKVGLVVKKNG